MAVTSSGQLRLRADIANEVDGSSTGSNVSLRSLSASAGLSSPDRMSELYGYTSAVPPSVTTNAISQLGETGFRSNGNISSDGGGTITQRGFYVGRSTNATSNAKYIVSGTTGGLSTYISGLINNTTYYVWAFATNSAGTTFGSRQSIRTIQTYTPNLYSGNSYGGYYEWMDNYPEIRGTFNRYYKNPYTGSWIHLGGFSEDPPRVNYYNFIAGSNHPSLRYAIGTENRNIANFATINGYTEFYKYGWGSRLAVQAQFGVSRSMSQVSFSYSGITRSNLYEDPNVNAGGYYTTGLIWFRDSSVVGFGNTTLDHRYNVIS